MSVGPTIPLPSTMRQTVGNKGPRSSPANRTCFVVIDSDTLFENNCNYKAELFQDVAARSYLYVFIRYLTIHSPENEIIITPLTPTATRSYRNKGGGIISHVEKVGRESDAPLTRNKSGTFNTTVSAVSTIIVIVLLIRKYIHTCSGVLNDGKMGDYNSLPKFKK